MNQRAVPGRGKLMEHWWIMPGMAVPGGATEQLGIDGGVAVPRSLLMITCEKTRYQLMASRNILRIEKLHIALEDLHHVGEVSENYCFR